MQSGARQLKLFILACVVALSCGRAHAEPTLRLDSNFIWDRREPWFGGFSGIEIMPGGDDVLLISDRGSLLRATLTRTSGQITGVETLIRTRLSHRNGRALRGSFRDAEGLAYDAARNRAFISFEHSHRVTTLNLEDDTTQRLEGHADFGGFPPNEGLETLAVHPDGRLFALAEGAPGGADTLPLFAQHQDGWQIRHRLAQRGAFVPVGGDFDAQGRLYLLERSVGPLGFRSRIRRFDLNKTPPASQTLLTTFPALFDNLEGLSVWTDRSGQTRLTLISDDNFLSIQRTQLVEFILTE